MQDISFPDSQHEERDDISNIKLEENAGESVALPELLNLNGPDARGGQESRESPAALSWTQIPLIASSLEDIKTEPMQQFQSDDDQVRLLNFFKNILQVP